MSGPSWSYLNWYHGITGDWATWEPGNRVDPGAVGSFDGELRFNAYRTMANFGVVPRIAITDRPGSWLMESDGEAHLDFKAKAESSPGLSPVGSFGAEAKASAKREHACTLHLHDRSEAWIRNIEDVMLRVQELLISGEWDVGWAVVTRRLEAQRGFAAISQGSEKSFGAKLDADARVMSAADLGSASLQVAPGSTRGDFLVFDFGPGSTPAFSAIRVRHDLWDKLLPWRPSAGTVIGPDGRAFRELPGNPADRALEARYDPERSALAPGELSAMAVVDLFEEVTDLPAGDDSPQSAGGGLSVNPGGRLLSFPLPVPPPPAALAAAGPPGSASAVGERQSPDGLARFTLLDQGDGVYWLEVSLAGRVESPLIVRLRYTSADQRRRELLVPVGGSSASIVALPGYDGRPWRGWSQVPLDSVWSGSPELLQASVRAAVTAGTVRAWQRVASAAPGYSRELITQAIDGAESW